MQEHLKVVKEDKQFLKWVKYKNKQFNEKELQLDSKSVNLIRNWRKYAFKEFCSQNIDWSIG